MEKRKHYESWVRRLLGGLRWQRRARVADVRRSQEPACRPQRGKYRPTPRRPLKLNETERSDVRDMGEVAIGKIIARSPAVAKGPAGPAFALHAMMYVCPGGRHAWYGSTIGAVRKPLPV